ncbi:Panacea domain-containing protein [Leptospira interrogans]
MRPIRFKFAAVKALAAIQWMLEQEQTVDLHTALKAFYFADKLHLNQHRRPIFGATYRAMKFGPVPLEVYEMMKGEPLWLAELGRTGFPWDLHGYTLRRTSNDVADLSVLSDTDREALRCGLQKSISMTFNERTAATHGPDWQAAKLGTMRYEDMIDEGPDKPALVAFLREAAQFLRL